MTHTSEAHQESGGSWEHIGRAAERLARRVARDASKFAERVQEHAGDFARDVSRDWSRMHWASACGDRRYTQADVRKIFEDVRGVLTDMIDGVDEFIERVFPGRSESSAGDWVRVVTNREATCGQCGRSLAAGDEAFVRRVPGGREFRCRECGPPATAGSAS